MPDQTTAVRASGAGRDWPVYAMFVASGAAALVYQVIWLRWLGLVFGNTTVSVSIVLASFMAGLALGSALVGRLLRGIGKPMQAYAFIELGIGGFALAFPLLSGLVETAYLQFANPDTPAAATLPLRAGLALGLLVLPTTLMGATLPLLAEFFQRSPRYARSWKAGLLYAFNTLGAAIGVFASGFVLIELVGVRGAGLCACGLNFAVALLALRFAARDGGEARPEPAARATPITDFDGRFALVALTLSGAAALASEVLWTRCLEIVLGNTTYAFSMIVLTWLLGIASGSLCLARLAPRKLPQALVLALAGMGLWTLGCIALIDQVRELVVQHYGKPISPAALLWQYFRASTILFPLAFLSGAMFPIATRLLERPGSAQATGWRIAHASAWNTVGSVAGSLGAGFLIAPRFDFFAALDLVAAFYALAAAGLLCALLSRPAPAPAPARERAILVAQCAAVALLAIFSVQKALEQSAFSQRLERAHPGLRVSFHKPGLQGITTVLKNTRDGGEMLLVNGQGMTRKGIDLRMMAHLPLFLHPKPDNTLVICFGMGTTYRTAMNHGGRVTVIELVDEVLEAFDQFYPDAAAIRADPRGHMRVNDGRNFLLLTQERFDVITLDPPPPINGAGVNNLYSRDFIELARSRLNEGGILAHWLPYPRTGAGVDNEATLGMLFKTFAAVFPHALVMPSLEGGGFHMLGSDRPIVAQPARIEAALQIETVRADLSGFPPDFLDRLVPWDSNVFHFGSRGGGAPIRFDPKAEAALISDDRPRLEFSLLASWREGHERYYPLLIW